MSRQSTLSLPLLDVRVQTVYSDDYGPVARSRTLTIEVPWGEVSIQRPRFNRYLLKFWWVSVQRWRPDLEDHEGMRQQYRAQRKNRV